jgi:drug/metabolite transporter (DMT)-like permease
LLGVAIFSFSFPATKLALRGLDPWAIGLGRAVVAAALAAPTLLLLRARLPRGAEWRGLVVVAGGVVVGFPALSSLALQSTGAAHGAVVNALLPIATAIAGTIRFRESHGAAFWLAATTGAALVVLYTLVRAGGAPTTSDLYLLAAIVVCALGYTEGAILSRTLGAPETICWALLLALPVTVPVAASHLPRSFPPLVPALGFAYVAVGSMFLGFFAWYAGLARGGVARVSQLMLIQAPLTLLWSAVVLDEHLTWGLAATAAGVVACIAVTQRTRISRPA